MLETLWNINCEGFTDYDGVLNYQFFGKQLLTNTLKIVRYMHVSQNVQTVIAGSRRVNTATFICCVS